MRDYQNINFFYHLIQELCVDWIRNKKNHNISKIPFLKLIFCFQLGTLSIFLGPVIDRISDEFSQDIFNLLLEHKLIISTHVLNWSLCLVVSPFYQTIPTPIYMIYQEHISIFNNDTAHLSMIMITNIK